jgi:hypothetical protein
MSAAEDLAARAADWKLMRLWWALIGLQPVPPEVNVASYDEVRVWLDREADNTIKGPKT